MGNENLNQTEPEPSPAENLSPEVSFVRNFLGRVTAILRADDAQKAKLSGPARLVAELLDSSCKVFLFKAEYEKLKSWQEKTDELQQSSLEPHQRRKRTTHFLSNKKIAPFNSQRSLASIIRPFCRATNGAKNFSQSGRSAFAEQQRLWRENIDLPAR